ncbi:MAG: hypothetical protein FVQ81_11560 [Candidatus Glassbacteria bacterium]|nr:hypothetical protein [Candidatus Glassbacteria bacterium]
MTPLLFGIGLRLVGLDRQACEDLIKLIDRCADIVQKVISVICNVQVQFRDPAGKNVNEAIGKSGT